MRKKLDKLGRPRNHIPNNKPMPFKQRDMERAIRAARRMGMPIGSVKVDPHTGEITITPGTAPQPDNEWDKAV